MTDTQPAALEMQGVGFAWPGRGSFGLEIPELRIEAGERVVLLGESGTGKSTVLSLVCGILTPQTGEIRLNGADLNAMSNRAKDRMRGAEIGVIFQQFNLLPFATAIENVLLPLQFAPARRARVPNPRVEALRLTRRLGLDDALVTRNLASNLSVGQQQRVAVARALIGSPKMIIADEPSSALDANHQTAFLDLLLQETRAVGASLLLVTHDDALASAFDRRLEMTEICRLSREVA